MANGNGEAALGSAIVAFLKGKLFSIIWMVCLSLFSVAASYKVFAYRIDTNEVQLKELEAKSASRSDEDRKQAEIKELLVGIRSEMQAEVANRQQNDAIILQEIRRANDRIDQLLRDAANRRAALNGTAKQSQ